MTPKLKLREQAKKALLSSMRKPRLPGNWRTRTSTQMTEAPKTHAARSRRVSGHWIEANWGEEQAQCQETNLFR